MPVDAFARFARTAADDVGWLLGFSGGVDSVVLAHLALRAARARQPRRALLAVHVHHGLRADADADAAWCRRWCDGRALAFRLFHADVPALARSEGRGVEDAGRRARHRCFAEAAGEGAWNVLLAHHADDQAETIWQRLERGADLRGLAGLAAETELASPEGKKLRLARPLLGVPKARLIAYAAENGLDWREDATNADVAFDRNRVRHDVLPALEREHPGASKRLLALASAARAARGAASLIRDRAASSWAAEQNQASYPDGGR
jgi:tRNA(Ile)-lysidine synthase